MKSYPKPTKRKPHGQACGIFTVSINDGYVEYAFDYNIGAHNSIDIVERKIRRVLGCKKVEGRLRTFPNQKP